MEKINQYLRPNGRYFLRSEHGDFVCVKNGDFGRDGERHGLVLTSKTHKKEPLKLVYTSGRIISFYSKNFDGWLRTGKDDNVFLDQNIEGTSKFEPLIGSVESDGFVLRTVQCWDNLCARNFILGTWVVASKDSATRFKFIAAN